MSPPPNSSLLSTPSTLIRTPDSKQQPRSSTSFYQQRLIHYMSHNTFTYSPTLFGHPHQTSQPQPSEPFWNQYPEWVDPEQQVDSSSYYYQTIQYQPPPTAAMAPKTASKSTKPAAVEEGNNIYIGYNTVNGRKKSSPGKAPNPKGGKPQSVNPMARGKVDVYANGVFLQEMPLKLLCRFSKYAAAAFPKPEMTSKAVNGDTNGENGAESAGKEGESTNWAEDDGDAQKLAAELAKLNTNPAPTPNTYSTTTADHRELNLYLDTLYLQPPIEAFDFSFKWMFLAQDTPYGEKPVDYGVTKPEHLSLEKLVDMYAAALVLELRPAMHKHRGQLMQRMTQQRPTLATLTYVHEHLPIDDIVVTRFVTSYFEHRDCPRSGYAPAELKEIEDYVCTVDEELHTRFMNIGEARNRRHQRYHDRVSQDRVPRAEAELQRGAEGLENGNGNGNGAAEELGRGGNGNVEAGGVVFVGAANGNGLQNGNGPRGGGKKQQKGGPKKKAAASNGGAK